MYWANKKVVLKLAEPLLGHLTWSRAQIGLAKLALKSLALTHPSDHLDYVACSGGVAFVNLWG